MTRQHLDVVVQAVQAHQRNLSCHICNPDCYTIAQVWDEWLGQENSLCAEGHLPLARLMQLVPPPAYLLQANTEPTSAARPFQSRQKAADDASSISARVHVNDDANTSGWNPEVRRQPGRVACHDPGRSKSRYRLVESGQAASLVKATQPQAAGRHEGAAAAAAPCTSGLVSEQLQPAQQPTGDRQMTPEPEPAGATGRGANDGRNVDAIRAAHGDGQSTASILLPLQCRPHQGSKPVQCQPGKRANPILRLKVLYSFHASQPAGASSNAPDDLHACQSPRQNSCTSQVRAASAATEISSEAAAAAAQPVGPALDPEHGKSEACRLNVSQAARNMTASPRAASAGRLQSTHGHLHQQHQQPFGLASHSAADEPPDKHQQESRSAAKLGLPASAAVQSVKMHGPTAAQEGMPAQLAAAVPQRVRPEVNEQRPEHTLTEHFCGRQATQQACTTRFKLPHPRIPATADSVTDGPEHFCAVSTPHAVGAVGAGEGPDLDSHLKHEMQDVWLVVRLKQATGLAAAAEEASGLTTAGAVLQWVHGACACRRPCSKAVR